MKERSAEATCWVSADNKSVISFAPSRASRSSRFSRMSRVSKAASQISQSNPKFFESEAELPQGYFQELQADQVRFIVTIWFLSSVGRNATWLGSWDRRTTRWISQGSSGHFAKHSEYILRGIVKMYSSIGA